MTPKIKVFLVLTLAALVSPLHLQAQETRGMIFGRVLDPQSSAVAGAQVTVTATDTGVSSNLESNGVGYYEATLLLPGNYEVTVQAPGFKQAVRSGIVLSVGARLGIDMPLELGAIAESVTVSAESPLLETSSVSSGRSINERAIKELPMMGNQPTLLIQLAPGMYHPGQVTYAVPGFNIANSRYFMPLNVGGNDWSVDGAPNIGNLRRVANVPHADTVQEFRVETSNFDASVGHATGASISMMTKAGTNQFHGSLVETHTQERWNGSSLFRRQLYYSSIAAAEGIGDTAEANRIRAEGLQPPGHTNSYAATIGGPIVRNKLFFFFSYWRLADRKNTPPGSELYTVPTLANRDGDFSDLIPVDATLYQIYDPTSVAADPARPGHFIRQPFQNNRIPQSKIINPAYSAYRGFLPTPNANPVDPTDEPVDNLNTANGPRIIDHKDFANRVDFNASSKHRFFGRWAYSDFLEDEDDWTFSTVRGLQSADLSRRTKTGVIDWVYTPGASTVLNFSVSGSEFNTANLGKVVSTYKPSDVGLPAYLDQNAGDQTHLPQMLFNGYAGFNRGAFPRRDYFRTLSIKADASYVRGNHSFRAGFDSRQYFRTNQLGGITSGQFSFDNLYTRRNEDTLTPAGNLGHSWASFMMGLPSAAIVERNDTYALHNPSYGMFFQDNWRVTPKLTLNLGLRFEYENGNTERFDRQLTNFDATAPLPITQAAEAAYAANPLPERPASDFKVAGGSLYAGLGGADRRRWGSKLMWMPRLAAAYQVSAKTVLRAGYGLFYDTLNPLNINPDQFGYSRNTSTTISNNFGQTWLAGNPAIGVSPMSDPFPVRADGTRFDSPIQNALGLMGRVGAGWSYYDFDATRPQLHRWRIGIQHQLSTSTVIEIGYTGSKADDLFILSGYRDDALPEGYWASGQARNNDVASYLNANLPNPFRLSNFESLRTSDPLVYQQMSTLPFFASPTIRREQLLRPFTQMNGLVPLNLPEGDGRTHSMEISLERRFARGFSTNIAYTALKGEERILSLDQFALPTEYLPTQNGRPHRLTFAGIFELPFGKGRPYLTTGPLNHLFGGWQIAATYEYQPGQLIEFPNLFYSGDLEDIQSSDRTLDRFFNTDGFEKVAARQPAAFHRRVFPLRVNGVRSQATDLWSANISRKFSITERVILDVRGDFINLMNRSQFSPPNSTPTSTNFGRITSAVGESINRLIQLQARISF